MNVTDGHLTLDLEHEKGRLKVRLGKNELKAEALKSIPMTTKVTEEDESWLLSYEVPEQALSLTITSQKLKSKLDRLALSQKLSTLSYQEGQFVIPFLHPENLFFDKGQLLIVHSGFEGVLAPSEGSDESFLNSVKALLLFVLNPKSNFEKVLTSEGGLSDKLSVQIQKAEDLDALKKVVDKAWEEENRRLQSHNAVVSKRQFRFFKYVGLVAIVVALVLGWFTYSSVKSNQKQNAIISAQTDFLTQNYAQTQSDLQNYKPDSLPKAARYVLAVSSVNLSNLNLTQKQAVLNNISTKSDDNTLNYWVYTGRSDFNNALNLAQNLGDNQLTLLAYTNLYETTKLNTSMDGAKKQQLLDDYNKKIQELTKTLKSN